MDTAQKSKILEKQRGGGTQHFPIEGIWLDIYPRVGTLHQIGLKFLYLKLGGGWVVVGGVVGGLGSLRNSASLKLHLASWNLKDFQSN